LVTNIFEFVDVLIIFWDQRSKVKVIGGNYPKNLADTISSYL